MRMHLWLSWKWVTAWRWSTHSCVKLIDPCAIDLAVRVMDEEAASKTQLVPFSDNKTRRGVARLCSKCAGWITSKTEVEWIIHNSPRVKRMLLIMQFCLFLSGMFMRVNLRKISTVHTSWNINNRQEHFLDFRSVFINHQPDWNRCIDICSDGLKLLKRMPKLLKCVLDNAVQIVNFIKAQPLYSRMFNLLCSDTGSEYENLIFVPKFIWLFRGKIQMHLKWVKKLQFFCVKKKHR
jgi:hypothetical protein